jgi:hypothetical protein
MPLTERFWVAVNKHGPVPKHCPKLGRCWTWTGSTNRKGKSAYGRISAEGAATLTSHVAWFLATGEWPTQFILHKCDTPLCVRFSHLFQGSYQDNSDDMKRKGRGVNLRGEAHGHAKLTAKQVQRIRTLYATGEHTMRALAKQFGLASKTSIGFIVKRQQWK